MSKYYAVVRRRKPCLYTDWSECEKQTIGYKGAIFKSFTRQKDAINFLKRNGIEAKEIPDFLMPDD